MSQLWQDLRYAVRTLRRDATVTIVAVASIALAIGANATIYTWLDQLVLHPLPTVPEVHRIAQFYLVAPQGTRWSSISYPDLQDWQRQTTAFSGIAGYNMVMASVRTVGQAERAFGLLVTSNYFDVLGIKPMLGRGFLPAEDSVAGAHPVAMISYDYWRRKFGADSAVVGSAATFNGTPFTIVGVTPPGFSGNFVGLSFDFWAPLTMATSFGTAGGALTSRDHLWISSFGRLKPGVTLARGAADVRTIEARLASQYSDDRKYSATALGFGSMPPVVWFRPAFLALLGITAVILLIACANVANLLLARAAGRTREMGIRIALGARRTRLVRQLLIESAVLAALGGAFGLAITGWCKGLFASFVPADAPIPIVLSLSVNGRVVAFAAVVTIGTVLLFGLAPALRASRPDLVPALKDESVGRGASRSGLRSALAVTQVALSMVALVAAGLFARSLRNAGTLDRGFTDPERVMVAGTSMDLANYAPARGMAFYQKILPKIAAVPGVRSVSLVHNVPLGFGGESSNDATISGYTPRPDENMAIQTNRVGPDYFATMGTRIVAGREFTAQDRAGTLPVVVVNRAFVNKYWPGLDAIGRQIDISGETRTVVGVVATGKYRQLNEPPTPFIFFPLTQRYAGSMAFVVRTAVPVATLIEPLRRLFADVDPNVPFLDPQSLATYTSASVFVQRAVAWMLGAFGVLALVLAGMGLYAVIAYGVAQRTRELGIRTALGAGRRELVLMVLRQGARIAAVGIVIGGGAAFGVAQLLRGQLLGVSPTDPPTVIGIAVLLGAVSMAASYLPARRAARVDPLVALRSE